MTAEEVRSAMHCSVREIRDNSRQVLVNALIGKVKSKFPEPTHQDLGVVLEATGAVHPFDTIAMRPRAGDLWG
jgi:hypothetical protein